MFFITTYGFLNLSCAVENWASPDFRPSFRIPSWVGIVGALACFLVMIELDILALFGATLVMGGIFLFLKKRELTLESGDTWEGVWSSLIRSGLRRLAPRPSIAATGVPMSFCSAAAPRNGLPCASSGRGASGAGAS
jgi:hypothetical protein